MFNDKDFLLKINGDSIAEIYLSCSWRPDAGKDAAWHIVKELDTRKIRVVGDIKDQEDQDDERIRRIMERCNGFIGVLPYRANSETTTSIYIIREILVAIGLNIPIILFYDSRINLEITLQDQKKTIRFPGSPTQHNLVFEARTGIHKFIAGEQTVGNQVAIDMNSFIENFARTSPIIVPYVFLITRLKDDYTQIRKAIQTAVKNKAGMECLWSDDGIHSTNITGIRERARLLIKNAHFIIADLSFDDESPLIDNPNRAHEIGMSLAFKKDILLCAQVPRRDPYYAADDLQFEFWNNEKELEKIVERWIDTNKIKLGRHTYNYELTDRATDYKPVIGISEFTFNAKKRYIAPNLYTLSTSERWITALGVGLLIFSLSNLISEKLGYDNSLDLASILAGIFAFLFSSELNNSIQKILGKNKVLIYIILITSIGLFGLSIFLMKTAAK